MADILLTSMKEHPFNSTDVNYGNLGMIAVETKTLDYLDGKQGILSALRMKAHGVGATHVTHVKIEAKGGEYFAYGNAWKKPEK